MAERISSYEITTSSSYNSDHAVVRPNITARNLIFQRTPAGSAGSRMGSQQQQFHGAMVPGGFGSSIVSEVTTIRSERDREKKDMQDLNERFASYIEKVRFLEAMNKKLEDELNKLKEKWGKESTLIRAMYQTEVDEAKRLLEEAEKERMRLEVKIAALEEQLDELRRKLEEAKAGCAESRQKLEHQNQQLSDYEAEMNLLKRRAELLEGDRLLDKRILARLQDAINRARIDLDNETLLHVDAENRRGALEEELEFLKQLHEQELRELAQLAYRDTTNDNRELWKSEMGSALKQLQDSYDEKLDNLRGEMDTFYNLRVQEFRTAGNRVGMDVSHSKEEITRVRNQIADLRAKINDLDSKNAAIQREIDEIKREMEEKESEMENENAKLQSDVAKLSAEKVGICKELEDLNDKTMSLELEIAAYRRLLEGEADREGLKQVVESMFSQYQSIGQGGSSYEGGEGGSWNAGGDSSAMSVRSEVRGQMSGRTTYQRSAKGPVTVCDASQDAVVIENTGRKEEDVSGWSVKRAIDGVDSVSFTIPSGTLLRSGAKVKFVCQGKRSSNAPSNEIETNVPTFGQGKDITTKLLNPNGEDRASHIQKTTYAS